MSQYILVHTTGSELDAAVFDLALQAARGGPAHLEFVHVSPDVRDIIAAMAPGLMGDGYEIQRIADDYDQASQDRARKAEERVQAFCTQNKVTFTGDASAKGITATFRREMGVEAAILPRYGRVADLTVAGRLPDNPDQLDLLGTLLLDTGRPVLLSPSTPTPLAAQTVAIAWKDTSQAARAVAAAHSFITAAEHVVVLTVDEGDPADDAAAARLAQVLAWQAQTVSTVHVPAGDQPPGDALLAAAAAAGAGLLVMGGYGHARLREAVIGGITRRVLAQADIPVLMAH